MKNPMSKLFYLLSVCLSLSFVGSGVWCKGSESGYSLYSAVHVEGIGIRDPLVPEFYI